MYVYNFEGKRYDVGDKLGFLEVIVDFVLKKEDFKEDFIKYLKYVCSEFDKNNNVLYNNIDEKIDLIEVNEFREFEI